MPDETLELALRDLALKFLGRREYSTRELQIKLQQKAQTQRTRFPKGNVSRAIASVIGYLTERGYLDDRRFAVALALSSRSKRRYGDSRIRRDLNQRGIDGNIVRSVLSELPDSAEALQAAIRTYIDRRGEPTSIGELQRLYRHLVRLGHAASLVRRQLSPFFKSLEGRKG